MTEAVLKSSHVQTSERSEGFLFSHLRRQRKNAAKVFPHCGEHSYPFSRTAQGQKLPVSSLKALKRV